MRVKLLKCTTNPEKYIASIARVCYSKRDPETILENMTDKQITKMVKKIIESGHLSLLEHITFTFGVSDISRVLSHQLVRHRMASYAQQSQRYVDFSDNSLNYFIPEEIKNNPEIEEIYNNIIANSFNGYNKLIELGIKPEDARYVLPNATSTNIIITMNGRSLFNFFKLRLCMRAQNEIREMAVEMFNILNKNFPLIFKLEYCGPACKSEGGCKESVPCFASK